MYSKIIKYLLENTRKELHGAVFVIIYGGSYLVSFLGLKFAFNLFGYTFQINYELGGYFVGCIGAGELARGVTKLYLAPSKVWKYYISASVAGFVTVSIFWIFMILKWGNPASSIPVAGASGALFYSLIAWLLILESRKKS